MHMRLRPRKRAREHINVDFELDEYRYQALSAPSGVSERQDEHSNVAMEPKEHLQDTIQAIREMRARRDAEVDHDGAEALPQGERDSAEFRFQALVALLLSSMTKDPVTAAAIRRLQRHGLTVHNIHDTPIAKIKELIKGVGFHNRKAQYLKDTAAKLIEEYHADIPRKLQDVMKLPGIGSKMAKITISVAWGDVVGIAADTHVHRIAARLGWTEGAKNPLQTEQQLEELIPKKDWKDINLLLVGFGQQICTARSPKCDDCLLNNGLCPKIGVTKRKSKSKKSRKVPK